MSFRKMSHQGWWVLALAVVIAAAGPGRRDRTGVSAATGHAVDLAREAAAPQDTLTDPHIVALFDQANQSDSAVAAYAIRRATNPDVQAYAELMMREHHALRVQGEAVVAELGIMAEPPTNNFIDVGWRSEMVVLEAAETGEEFDRIYIDEEVKVHETMLALNDEAYSTTQQLALQVLLLDAQPVYERHLVKARELQRMLSKSAGESTSY